MSGSRRNFEQDATTIKLSTSRRLLGTRQLVESSVYDPEGKFVGKLEEIVIDARTGCIRHAVVAIGGVFGIGRRRLAVPWSVLTPDEKFKRCVADVAQMELTAVQIPSGEPWLQSLVSPDLGNRLARRSRTFGAAD